MSQQEAAPADRWTSSLRFGRFAWFVLGYLLLVILWGAWVRISGSGAGCGAHWPTCNGEVIPLNPTLETIIEYTHRLTSGLSLPLVIALVIAAFKRFPKGHGVRWASVGSLFFLCTEAALGAGLVKFELVANDTSVARALTASFHLINTYILCAFTALCAWWGQYGFPAFRSKRSQLSMTLVIGLIGLILTGMSGAITALGDTLFPTSIFNEHGLMPHLIDQVSASTHFLVQLRIVHPIIAVITGVYLLILMPQIADRRADLKRGTLRVTALVVIQLLLGILNILLAAPGWMQIVHLLMALAVWLSGFLLWVQLLEGRQQQPRLQELQDDSATV